MDLNLYDIFDVRNDKMQILILIVCIIQLNIIEISILSNTNLTTHIGQLNNVGHLRQPRLRTTKNIHFQTVQDVFANAILHVKLGKQIAQNELNICDNAEQQFDDNSYFNWVFFSEEELSRWGIIRNWVANTFMFVNNTITGLVYRNVCFPTHV